jgi:hypothetical protein
MPKHDLKPIQTTWNGYRFRSRTEARWAILLDALGLKFEYEKEGYALPSGECYLPDFFIPNRKVFIEVKADIGHDSMSKVVEFAAARYTPVYVAIGSPISNESTPMYRIQSGGDPVPCGLVYCPVCEQVFIAEQGQTYREYLRCGCLKEGLEEAVARSTPTIVRLAIESHPGVMDRISESFDLWLHNPSSGRVIREAFRQAKSARFEFGETGPESKELQR